MSNQTIEVLIELYEDFNARRIEAVLDRLDAEVLDSSEVVHQNRLRDGLVTEMTIRGETLD